MSASTLPTRDRALISTLVSTLLSPVPPSEPDLVPPALLGAINAAHSHAVKLLIGPSSVRHAVEQLQDLREKEMRQADRRRERHQRGKGTVVLSSGPSRAEGKWVNELPRDWPGSHEGDGGENDDEREYYATLRKRILSLEAESKRKQAQLDEIKSLAGLATVITPHAVATHNLTDPNSDLSRALDRTATLLPRANSSLRESEPAFVAAKRQKLAANGRRGGAAPAKQVKVEGQSSGSALMGMF